MKKYGFVKEDIGYRSFKDPVTIGNDVWIGSNAIVLRGVKIEDGAVIGAGSVVTHNVGAYEIWAGVPARKIKNRFDECIIETLKDLKWWDLPEDIIKKNIEIFQRSITINDIVSIKKRLSIDKND